PDSSLESDYAIYPPPKNDGFAVLRQARVPAVLCESSFHSNPAEEARLRDPLYNRREAYGMFIGLARWAQAGLPRITMINFDPPAKKGAPTTIVVRLDDGFPHGGKEVPQRLDRDSVIATLEGKRLSLSLDKDAGEAKITLPAGAKDKRLFVDFEN